MATNPVDQLIRGFKTKNWRSEPMERAMAIAVEHPEMLLRLAQEVMEQIPEGGTFLDAALSFLPMDDWPELVRLALQAWRNSKKCESAGSVIAYASLQCPAVLHPHLESIFVAAPNGKCYYRNWPWRESGLLNFEFLSAYLTTSKHSAPERMKAWECLLETRHPEALHNAVLQSQSVRLNAKRAGLPPVDVAVYLLHVGFEQVEDQFRRLYADQVFHLSFPRSYLPGRSRPAWNTNHPTWNLGKGTASARFGGSADGSCRVCGGGLHHLVTLNPIPKGLGVTRLSALNLVTCRSCLGWEEPTLSFQHDRSGQSIPVGYDGPIKKPEFPSGSLRKTSVSLVAADQRWRWQDWALSNSRENLNRVGGHPTWIQGAEYPQCVLCQNTMRFLLQLDSNTPGGEDGGEWLWGSGGICYCFWCDRCKVSCSLWQCT